MEFTVGERLALLGLLPPEGNVTTLRIVRELREALSFTEAEHERWNIVVDPDRVEWREDGGTKTVEVGAKASRLIVDRLEELNKDGKLTELHLSLCDKFGIGE